MGDAARFYSTPVPLGGQLAQASALSAVSWGAGRLDVFGAANDHTIPYWWYDNGSGNFNTQPEIVGDPYGPLLFPGTLTALSTGPNQLHLFAYGTDGTNIQLLYWESQ